VALLFLAVAAALLVSQRRSIARWLLLGEIHRAGIEAASLEVETVSVEGLSRTDLRLGAPPALEIARIDARYSPAGLWKGHLDELSIWGLRLWASLGNDGLSLGALDALLEGDSAGAGSRLDLADCELSVAKLDASARLEEGSGEGSLRIGELRDLQSPARVEPLGRGGQVRAEVGQGGGDADQEVSKRSTILISRVAGRARVRAQLRSSLMRSS
jgi:hypothetical protein